LHGLFPRLHGRLRRRQCQPCDANADHRISRSELLNFVRSQPRPNHRDKAYLTSAIGIAVASIDGKNPQFTTSLAATTMYFRAD
jgi:hypothetical protein